MTVKKIDATEDPWSDDKPSMSVETNYVRDLLTVTIKGGAGFDAPWHVIHASSVEEAISILDHDEWPRLVELTTARSREFSKQFGPSGSPSKGASGAVWSGNTSKPSQASGGGSQPAGTCPTHNCPLVFQEAFKNPKTQKLINAKMGCPVPKCYEGTIWQNDDGSWPA